MPSNPMPFTGAAAAAPVCANPCPSLRLRDYSLGELTLFIDSKTVYDIKLGDSDPECVTGERHGTD